MQSVAVWQLFVDEATARNFILNAFEDVRVVEGAARNPGAIGFIDVELD